MSLLWTHFLCASSRPFRILPAGFKACYCQTQAAGSSEYWLLCIPEVTADQAEREQAVGVKSRPLRHDEQQYHLQQLDRKWERHAALGGPAAAVCCQLGGLHARRCREWSQGVLGKPLPHSSRCANEFLTDYDSRPPTTPLVQSSAANAAMTSTIDPVQRLLKQCEPVSKVSFLEQKSLQISVQKYDLARLGSFADPASGLLYGYAQLQPHELVRHGRCKDSQHDLSRQPSPVAFSRCLHACRLSALAKSGNASRWPLVTAEAAVSIRLGHGMHFCAFSVRDSSGQLGSGRHGFQRWPYAPHAAVSISYGHVGRFLRILVDLARPPPSFVRFLRYVHAGDGGFVLCSAGRPA